MFVKPREGMRVLRPNKRPLPPEGAEVFGDEMYWERFRSRGDIEVVDDPPAPTE
jgi:hypothetical protein